MPVARLDMPRKNTLPHGAVTTVLYEDAGRIAEKYQAWVLLHEQRRISKQDAVNEIIIKSTDGTLPAEFKKALKK